MRISFICYFGLLLVFSGFMTGCAPGVQERLASAEAYASQKPEETAAWFATNSAPMTLRECRTLAHARTLKLTRARLNAELAHLQTTASFSAFLPQVEASYGRSGTHKTLRTNLSSMGITAQMQDRWVTDAAITISQPLFAPNAWLLWVAAKRGEALQTLVSARNEEMLDVQLTTLFYRAAIAARTVEVYRAQVAASRSLKQQIDALYAEGLAVQGDVARIDAIVLSDQYNEGIARDNAFAAKADLLDLLNFYPLSPGVPDPDGDSLLEIRTLPWARTADDGSLLPCSREEAMATPLEEWLWAALVNRKEMWAGDLEITLHKVRALAALVNFLPTLSVSGGGAYSSNSYLTPDQYLTSGIGGVMSVFDGLQSIAEYRAARKEHEAAIALREDCAATLLISVWQAWTNLRQARERAIVAHAAAHATALDYDEVYARHQNGQETLSEVLDKYSARERARIDALSSGYAEALAEMVFRDAIGLGWGDDVPQVITQQRLETEPLLNELAE